MGKYSKFEKKEVIAPYKIHPIWRMFGFLMIFILPIMSGAAAWELVNGLGSNLPYVSSLRGNLEVPPAVYSVPVISGLVWQIASIPNLPALAIFFLIFLILLSGIVSLLYSMIYRLIGPPRYTPIDAPAPRASRTQKYKR